MSPVDPLDRLIADWLSNSITPEDFRTLDARLRTDPAARAALRRNASLDAGLRVWETGREISAAWATPDAPTPEGSSTRATPSLLRRWRWPLVLAGLLLATNVIALNWDWWRLKSEGEALHAGMIRVYKTAFPNDVVIVDPLVQMQQKITALRKRSGDITPADFLSLAATLGEIEKTLPDKSVNESTKFSIAALEYRDAVLVVRFKPGTNPPTEAVRTALAARHITLTDAPPENGATVWRLRSTL